MSPANKAKPLIAYLRQSRTKERSISIGEQRDAIEQWAKARVETVVFDDRYVERNVSGAKPWQERELGAVVAALQAGEASGIAVAYQDRLARPTWLQEAEVWEALSDADGRLVCAAEGTDFRPGNIEHSDARLLYRIKAATARHAWERHCRNWRKGKHAAWERGAYVGPAPAGYSRDGNSGLMPNEHAPVIRAAFELKAQGGSASEVAKLLTASGVRTYRGAAVWSKMAARSIFPNEVYCGLHRCTCGCGAEVVRPEWEIVPRWLWRKAQPGKATTPFSRGEGVALGGGLCRCSVCGGGLVKSSTAGGRYTMLRCQAVGKGHACISYPLALDWILGVVFVHAVGWTAERSGGNADEIAAADARVEAAREALAEVEALRGTVRPAAFAVALSDAQAELEAAEEARAGLTLEADDVKWLTPLGSREKFETLSVPEQRRVLHKLIDHVVVRPGRALVSERVTVTFADGSVYPAPFDPAFVPAVAERAA